MRLFLGYKATVILLVASFIVGMAVGSAIVEAADNNEGQYGMCLEPVKVLCWNELTQSAKECNG